MAPRVVVFVLHADPNPVERLGAPLPDGSLVDLQAAHLSMFGRPSALFRDRTAFRLKNEDALRLAHDVVEWASSQRPPGVVVRADLMRVVDEHPAREGAPAGRRAPP